jgi:flavin reductase (DIM6/NTAB) family NADH-FMN oxidoreductase RutF
MVQTDYCGIMTGKKTDKAALFDVFYGDLETAPMIRQCPVCMECSLERVVDFPNYDVFVGEVRQTHVDESVLSEGAVDLSKVRPLLFDMSSKQYWSLGGILGNCWNVGKALKRPKSDEA